MSSTPGMGGRAKARSLRSLSSPATKHLGPRCTNQLLPSALSGSLQLQPCLTELSTDLTSAIW